MNMERKMKLMGKTEIRMEESLPYERANNRSLLLGKRSDDGAGGRTVCNRSSISF